MPNPSATCWSLNLAKYREATARDSIGAASPDARVISRALVSNTPSWPKKLPTVLIAAFATFMLSAGFVLSGQLLGGLPSGSIRPVKKAPSSEGQDVPMSVRASAILDGARASAGVPIEAVEGLARALGGLGESGRRISVLGMRRNIGTTLTAITLARALAKQGRVVLVDLAFASPSLSIISSDADAPGISELVLSSATFGDVITRDRYSRVHVIGAGRATANANAIMSTQQLAVTLEALARSYDYLVIDAGALPDMAAERTARLAPRAVLVVDDIEGSATDAAREGLLNAGFSNVSVIANADPATNASGRRAAA